MRKNIQSSGTVPYRSRYSKMDQVEFFKGCLPQILLGPFLNTLTPIKVSRLSEYMYQNVIKIYMIFEKLPQRKFL